MCPLSVSIFSISLFIIVDADSMLFISGRHLEIRFGVNSC